MTIITNTINPIHQPNVESPNRGYDNPRPADSPAPVQVDLHTIDEAIAVYISETIRPTINDGGTSRPVPVFFSAPEKWKTIQKDGYTRDPNSDKIQLPFFALRRSNIVKGTLWNPSNKHLHMTMASRWNPRNAYDRFAIQNRVQPSQHYTQIIFPDYVNVAYECVIWTEKVHQLNEVIEQLAVETDEWWGKPNSYKFRVVMDDVSVQTDLPLDNDRVVRANFNLLVYGYIIPEKVVQNHRHVANNMERYSAKKGVKIVEAVSG